MDKWIPGVIITRLGMLHYEVDFCGKTYKRHVDQIRAFIETQQNATDDTKSLNGRQYKAELLRRIHFYETASQASPQTTEAQPLQIRNEPIPVAPSHTRNLDPPRNKVVPEQLLRRSTRFRKPVQRFSPI